MKIFNFLFEKKTKETSFKIDLGNGIETKLWSQMQNLTKDELEYVFKNAKHCTSLEFIQNFDTSNISNINEMFKNCEIPKKQK